MAIEIRIIEEKEGVPPFLVIKDDYNILSFFPITQVQYQGKFLGTNDSTPDLRTPRTLLNGIIHFYDIFDTPHILDYTKNDLESSKWGNRINFLDKQANKLNKNKEDNPLKRMHPRMWSDVPENEWPDWMMN